MRKLNDDKQGPPLVKGGQGRTGDDFAETVVLLVILWGGLALAIAICAVIP